MVLIDLAEHIEKNDEKPCEGYKRRTIPSYPINGQDCFAFPTSSVDERDTAKNITIFNNNKNTLVRYDNNKDIFSRFLGHFLIIYKIHHCFE